MRSTAAPAARKAAISAGSLRMRSGPRTSTERRQVTPGRRGSRSTRKRDHIWSPTATVRAPWARTSSAVMATGSSVSFHGRSENTSGISTTRGASRRGITRVTSPCRGTTSIVSRSSGMAWYPTSQGRSRPTERRRTSTSRAAIEVRVRVNRSRKVAAMKARPTGSDESSADETIECPLPWPFIPPTLTGTFPPP